MSWEEELQQSEALVVHDDDGRAELASSMKATHAPMPSVGDGGDMMSAMLQSSQAIDRDPKRMIERAKQIGGLLGKQGFYSWEVKNRQTGKMDTIEGESVNLAQALAQDWGGIVYQTHILRAEPMAAGGQRIHLRSRVIDMRALVCSEVDHVVSTAPPPGGFAKKHDQSERWHSMQIQSAASKVERNAILDVLPKWYVTPAFNAAKAAHARTALGRNEDGSPRTLDQARTAALQALIGLGCEQPELETYVDQPYEMWAVPQIGVLRELFSALRSGAIAIEAWRHSIQQAAEEQSIDADAPRAPKRNALGLPNGNGKTVDDEALRAALQADKAAEEPVEAKPKQAEPSKEAAEPKKKGK